VRRSVVVHRESGLLEEFGHFRAVLLVCRQCGGKLNVIAYVGDEISVTRILAAYPRRPGPEPAGEEKPPPICEVVRVPVDDEGRGDPGQLRTAPSILTLAPPGA
jgi:hypothetical protein